MRATRRAEAKGATSSRVEPGLRGAARAPAGRKREEGSDGRAGMAGGKQACGGGATGEGLDRCATREEGALLGVQLDAG